MSVDLVLMILVLFGLITCGLRLRLIASPRVQAIWVVGIAFHPLLWLEWGQEVSWRAVAQLIMGHAVLESFALLLFIEALAGLGLVLLLRTPEGHRFSPWGRMLLCLPPVPLIVAQHLVQLRVFHHAVQQSFTVLAVSVAVGGALLLLLFTTPIRHRWSVRRCLGVLSLLLVAQAASGILLPLLLGETEAPGAAMAVDWTATFFFLTICSLGLLGGALRAVIRRKKKWGF